MAGEMKRLHDRGVPLRDMTVLYRAHYVTRAVEEALMHEKFPIRSTPACSFSTAWRSRTHFHICG